MSVLDLNLPIHPQLQQLVDTDGGALILDDLRVELKTARVAALARDVLRKCPSIETVNPSGGHEMSDEGSAFICWYSLSIVLKDGRRIGLSELDGGDVLYDPDDAMATFAYAGSDEDEHYLILAHALGVAPETAVEVATSLWDIVYITGEDCMDRDLAIGALTCVPRDLVLGRPTVPGV